MPPAKKAKKPPTVYHALKAAQQDLQNISKDGKNKHMGYAFTSAETMIRESREALHKNTLCLVPNQVTLEPYATSEHGDSVMVKQSWYLILVDETNDRPITTADQMMLPLERVWTAVPTRGQPTDKTVASAMTASLSYLLRDLLLLPRGDEPGQGMDDRDDNPRNAPVASNNQSRSNNPIDDRQKEMQHQIRKGDQLTHQSGKECTVFYVKGNRIGAKYGAGENDVEWGNWPNEWKKGWQSQQVQPDPIPSEPSEPSGQPWPPSPPPEDYDPSLF